MRARWNSKLVFVMAAVGSAVGLGNIWRFPYLVGKYGGGSFLIPYLAMLIIIGIPLMILEFGLGEKMQKGAVKALSNIKRPFSMVGYAALIAGFFIITYYAVVIAWALIYFVKSFTLSFKGDTQKYFFENVLHLSPSIDSIGGINLQIVVALAIVWIIVFLGVFKGVKSITKAIEITLPIPFILIIILAIRGVTLPGALEGVIFYLKPNFIALLDVELWVVAIAQAFFSLSLGSGIMIAYASYESKKSSITENAFTISFLDFFIAFIAGFAVFGTLGYMATQAGVSVASLATEGPGLAFIVFPQALLAMPGSIAFSLIFFLILITLGLSSAFSMVQAIVTPITDIFGEKSNAKVSAIVCILAAVIGLLYTTGAGMYFLDIIDHFVTSFPILMIGLFECIAVGWVYKAEKMRDYINSVSKWQIGKWWDFSIKYVTPILIIFLLVFLFVKELTTPYGDYPLWALMIGWSSVLITIIVSLLVYYLPKKR